VVAYHWDTDTAVTWTTAADNGINIDGSILFWNEGSGASGHAGRLGGGRGPVTTCATAGVGIYASGNASKDGRTIVVPCSNQVIAFDMTTGQSRTALAAPGAVVTPSELYAISPDGRVVAVNYSTNAPAGDPASCGSGVCTWLFDMKTGAGAQSPAVASLYPEGIVASDDGSALLLQALWGGSLLASVGPGALSVGLVNDLLGAVFGGGADGRYFIGLGRYNPRPGTALLANTKTGSTVAVELADVSYYAPARIGASNDFVVRAGILHLDTGATDPLGSGWQASCRPSATFAWLDGPSGPWKKYTPGTGITVLSGSAKDLGYGTCDGPELFLKDFDGTAGTLVRYDRTTGTIKQLAPRVAAPLALATAQLLLAFQNADSASGDLLLIDPALTKATALQARALRSSMFTSSAARVAFTGPAAGGPDLFAAALDGSGARNVGPDSPHPRFSPDGSHLLFASGDTFYLENPAGPPFAVDAHVKAYATDVTGTYILYLAPSGTWAFAPP
jgi:hypothetical protein